MCLFGNQHEQIVFQKEGCRVEPGPRSIRAVWRVELFVKFLIIFLTPCCHLEHVNGVNVHSDGQACTCCGT